MMSMERLPAGERRIPGRLPGARIGAALPVFILLAGVAFAQIYPPGIPPSYPGQRPYPGSGRPSPQVPLPSKGSKPDNAAVMPNFRGLLKQMDAKSITLKLDDDRVLEFKRTDKTKFFKNGDEIKTPDFKPGDQISVEGPEDERGYMTAVNVYWEKSAAAAAAAGAPEGKKDGGVDAWAVDTAAPPVGTEVKPPPAKPDPDDPGPPQLRRGKPADQSRERAAEVPAEPPAPQVAEARIPPAEAPPPGGFQRPRPPRPGATKSCLLARASRIR